MKQAAEAADTIDVKMGIDDKPREVELTDPFADALASDVRREYQTRG